MAELPKQRWHFELGRAPQHCKVFLNDEQWFNIKWFKIEMSYGGPTSLTFEVYPHEVVVNIDPSLQGEMDDGLFRERRSPGPTHQSL